MNLPTTTFQLGKYKVLRKLGNGQFGYVYEALDMALAARKAIKIIELEKPDELLSTLLEANILDKCRHKNIVQINEANVMELNGKQVVVLDLEYADGGSLSSEMEKRFLSVKESICHISSMLSGLEYAHNQGFLHRDIKPANILVSGGVTKLSDFGLATVPTGKIGSGKGYVSHLAPETLTKNVTTIQTDIYASGITLFRLVNQVSDWHSIVVSQKDPQKLITNGTLLNKIGFQPYIPQQIKRILSKACTPILTKRFHSALEMRQALDKLRYNIVWNKNSPDEWSGADNHNSYTMEKSRSARGVISVEFSKNGRMQSDKCKKNICELEAVACMNNIVMNTTFG